MKKYIIILVVSSMMLLACSDPYTVEATRSRWGIGIKMLEPFDIYAETRLTQDTTWHKVFYSESSPISRGIYVDHNNRPPDDTITAQYFNEYIDTVLLYYIDGLDTHHTHLDLSKFDTYYLKGTSIFDDGQQNFLYVVDIDSSSFN